MALWQNWAGNIKCNPEQFAEPETEAEIQQWVNRCRNESKTLRVVGAGHSFTPLVASDHVLLSLDKFQGLLTADRDKALATARAGTRLKTLGEALFAAGLAQENLGDIDVQSIAGAIATGTHGTGMSLKTIAAQARALTLVNGKGELVTCSPQENQEWLPAARISLGSLGVVSRVQLQLRPTYKLAYTSKRSDFDDCLSQLDHYRDKHRHFEFYWFPHSKGVQLKFMDLVDEPVSGQGRMKTFNELVLENWAFQLLSTLCKRMPRLCGPASRLCASLVTQGREVNHSHHVFASRRLVRFQEMEYNIPVAHMARVIREIRALIEKRRFAVHFPLECRFVAADDIWLSPAYGRDSAYIAVHMFQGMPFERYFREVEEIFLNYEGRPHWGKWHSLSADTLADKYPRWQDFLKVRAQMDPEGVFLSPYLRKIFAL